MRTCSPPPSACCTKGYARTLAADADPDASPMERFEAVWTKVVESFATHRPLWAASFELLAQIDQAPSGRDLAQALQTIVADVGASVVS